jgi:pyridoxine 4-dehydrogenase
VSKVGARRDKSGGRLPYDEPDQLRRGIEDNLRSLGVEQLAVNLRLVDGSTPNLANRASMPVLDECNSRKIAFVHFFPLGSGFTQTNPVLGNERVLSNAKRLGITPAQVALAWTLGLAPNILLIPGTSSVRHWEENLAVADIELDEEAQQQLAAAAG